MPRLYGRINRINKSQLSVQVTWLERKDDESVPVACGRFEHGLTETMQSYLTLSHEVHPITNGRNFIAVKPREGETWALFRDWSTSWNNNPEQHKPPYRYDLVEVICFDDHLGFGVAYLGKVEGFVSVFKHDVQDRVISFLISPEEIHRFSHRVPSFRLNGEEKEGVPAGSFELDPAAVPSSILKLDPAAVPSSILKLAQSVREEAVRCVDERPPILYQYRRTVMRNRACNLARLRDSQTPLLGGENPELHSSDFTGVTPGKKDIQTPNPMLTPSMTPGGASLTPRIGLTPSRDGSSFAMTPKGTPFT
ncbi:unnamed protein product [Arabis nemorensis]|uniref:DUF3444 domain-containing protein n=1 Tax=Arabis nemorensis TaxID=586526 RepID=A0A565ANX3_9BRAS|nr:unnamed protein product [Arabis nemorensis]